MAISWSEFSTHSQVLFLDGIYAVLGDEMSHFTWTLTSKHDWEPDFTALQFEYGDSTLKVTIKLDMRLETLFKAFGEYNILIDGQYKFVKSRDNTEVLGRAVGRAIKRAFEAKLKKKDGEQ